MRVGDEFVVRMPGPWDGPVRVVERDPDARFRLVTLAGHLEAGQIEFRASTGTLLEFDDRVLGAQRRPPVGPALRPPADVEGDPVPHVDVVPRARRRAVRRQARRRPRIHTRRVEELPLRLSVA